MKAMIFAAGLGTRLKPITDTTPKALVPINGVPLLEILLNKLKSTGIDEVVINVHHFANQVIDFLADHQNFGLKITISYEESQLLETGGGLKKAAPYLLGDAPVLVHNVDILSNADLAAFCANHRDADATLLINERESSRRLLFDHDNRLVGWTNIETGEVKTPYSNLCIEACKHYAFAGIQLISPKLFAEMEHFPTRFSIIDFYLAICHRVMIRGHVQNNLKLIDVGKLDTLCKAEQFLKDMR